MSEQWKLSPGDGYVVGQDGLLVGAPEILARIAALESALAEAQRERDEARAYGERLYAECTGNARDVACAFCSEKFAEGTPRSQNETLTAHVKVCAKHPMRDVERERDEAREEAAESERLYRALYDGSEKVERQLVEVERERDEARDAAHLAHPDATQHGGIVGAIEFLRAERDEALEELQLSRDVDNLLADRVRDMARHAEVGRLLEELVEKDGADVYRDDEGDIRVQSGDVYVFADTLAAALRKAREGTDG